MLRKILTPTAGTMALTSLHSHTRTLWIKPVATTAFLAFVSPGFAAEGPSVGTLPYANNSTVENQLDFASTGTAVAPIPDASSISVSNAVGSSTTSGSGSGGSWALSASGSAWLATLHIAIPSYYTVDSYMQAGTRTTGASGTPSNALEFYTATAGFASIASISPVNVNWSASYTIPSSGISLVSGQQYRYEFDLALSTSLINLQLSALGGVNLTISDNSGTLYTSGSDTGLLQNLLGLNGLYLQNQSVNNAGRNFTYSSGDLTITWSGTQSLSASVLSFLTSDIIYTVSNTDIIVIPEPETFVLAAVGGTVLMTTLRRRFRKL